MRLKNESHLTTLEQLNRLFPTNRLIFRYGFLRLWRVRNEWATGWTLGRARNQYHARKNQKELVHGVRCGLTTQAPRPSSREAVQRDCCSNCARDATIATATLPPGSLQRMVRRHDHSAFLLMSLSQSIARCSPDGEKAPWMLVLR